PEDSITLLYGGPRTKVRLRLIWRSRITAFIARSHGIVQPAAGSLILSDLDTNLSLQFES
ncbi:MAG: hypothetical protein FWD91_01375, partial [Treponema sp.]|nr:hypothetical protein [Treponema sp.]